ncbi:glycoside hydrolase family 2 protein [Paenibacillus arenilitoris]|uniref:Beta-glucuronidase n=1 Tax=Paenibacillus arenilitoris TaxID=2772299 RepID=A0A927CQ71_9BACL|nr:glycoside hydrolase family 2 TIM barrel-domain containing protein [Paenibacillus arenilitoris]MBD2871072.1 beta-glucuronidase [Paenibacillus arenilitoris]
MIRLFQTNDIRKVEELEGMWEFATMESGHAIPAAYPRRLPVPGCWENHPLYKTYRGAAAYRRRIQVKNGATNLRFTFKGVSHTARVIWDGVQVASHYNAYTAFSAIVREVPAGEHELIVVADNSFHEHSSLHQPNDYYSYGGITRPVVMEEVPDVFLERLQFTPRRVEGEWVADVQAFVTNNGEATSRAKVHCELDGVYFELEMGSVGGGQSTVLHGSAKIPGARPWSVSTPNLYALKARLFLDDAVLPTDDLIERVGFRSLTTERGKIQLNGEDIILKGFNRHEDHPMAGCALPLALMVHDLDLMEDMGANTVRTSHYPNDERFLDLCDERGILVWEENHARGFSIEQMRHPKFVEQCEDVNREMVEQHANHPSIIVWGILNECASDCEEGRVHYIRQLDQIRSMDPSRPLTFASHHRDREMCFDLVDIVSFNLYPGWYGDEDPGELVDQARGWAETGGGAGKPIIMSEFGGDGYYGYRDASRVRGTEERQADIIEANLAAYSARSYLSGMLIWQFSDCRVTEGTGWLLSRAGTQNSKGIVDRYRRPKLAYDVVKSYFRR